LLLALEHEPSKVTTSAERAVAQRLQANCDSPVASYAELDGDTLHLDALVARCDGSEILRLQMSGARHDAKALGFALADELLLQGAARLLGPVSR
jgi:hydroxymethylbilane synthase